MESASEPAAAAATLETTELSTTASMLSSPTSRTETGHHHVPLGQLPSAVDDDAESVKTQQGVAHAEKTPVHEKHQDNHDDSEVVVRASRRVGPDLHHTPSSYLRQPPPLEDAGLAADHDMATHIDVSAEADDAARIDRLVVGTFVPTKNTLFPDPTTDRRDSHPTSSDTLVTTVTKPEIDRIASSHTVTLQGAAVLVPPLKSPHICSPRQQRTSSCSPDSYRILSQSHPPVAKPAQCELDDLVYVTKSAAPNGSSSTPRRSSLNRLLHPTGNRIHPITAYAPSSGAHAYESDDGELHQQRPLSHREEMSRSSVGRSSVGRNSTGRLSARRNSVGKPSAGRNSVDRNSVGRTNASTLATQTVQIAEVGPPLAKHTQRYIYDKTRASLADMFDKPAQSRNGRLVVRLIFVCIIINIGTLAMETCDGQNYGSSAPGYPYLPDVAVHKAMDALFTMIFTLEFLGRVVALKCKRTVLTDPLTWIDVLALSPWYLQLVVTSAGEDFDVNEFNGLAHTIGLLRLLRISRLGFILRYFESMKILVASVKASVPPLMITMFFLFTLTMLLATAIFYAEPCYNFETCPFTDIFNSAYFIMVTIATVGYGNQVPSQTNMMALGIAFVAMVFGQLYLAMPLAIVGNNFQDTYEDFQQSKRRRLRRHDTTLNPFDFVKLNRKSQRLCEIQFHLLHAWRVVQLNIDKLLKKGHEASEAGKYSSVSDVTKSVGTGDPHSMETQLQAQVRRHLKLKEAMEKLLEVHAEACGLLQTFVPHKRKPRVDSVAALAGSDTRLFQVWKAFANSRFGGNRETHHSPDAQPMPHSHRGRMWLALEVPDSSALAAAINRVMVGFASLSVWIFFCESLPELMSNGVETSSCLHVVEEYCSSVGFARLDGGCFQQLANHTADLATPLDFACSSVESHSACYGNGYNFGSLATNVRACEDMFTPAGASVICYRMQCIESPAIVNMEPYWIYFEWCFGFSFLAEMLLRLYASPVRRRFFSDVYNIFDVLAVLPFVVELCDFLFRGVQPSYTIVATAPSFLSIIRVLKTMRILKLTRHFRGTKVLLQTAKETYRQLLIPIFFLLTMCILAAAVFFEIERGTECFVGQSCIWWNKEVLTPELAVGLPWGKRVLIQDRKKSIITDMMRSTWLSAATFTTVGYGDMRPRTPVGRMITMGIAVIGTIYTSMPITLVGGKFRSLYARHVEKVNVRRAGSSTSWKTKRNLLRSTRSVKLLDPEEEENDVAGLEELARLFKLEDDELELLRQFQSMKRTLQNLQRHLDNLQEVNKDVLHRIHPHRMSIRPIAGDAPVATVSNNVVRKAGSMEHAVEEKSQAILDTLLQFSRLVEKLQDAPPFFEAFLPEDTSNLLNQAGVGQLLPDAVKNRLLQPRLK